MTMDIAAFMGTPSGIFRDFPWWNDPVREKGQDCPTCGRLLKVYHRRLSRSMARSLVRLYRLTLASANHQKFFHVKQFDKEKARGEFGVLSSWGLVEEAPNNDRFKKTSGMWAITPYGTDFVLLRESLPQYVILKWRSGMLGYSGPMVNVKDCLEHGNHFKYDELMGSSGDILF
jgi:hypothetical protein